MLPDDFWSRVDKTGDCWVWTGSRTSKDPARAYGLAYRNGRKVVAHRLAWELTFGTGLPVNVQVCHRCDNPPCVRPAHLFLGSASDNQRDAVSKGRYSQQTNLSATCRNGHPFTPENTIQRGHDGARSCRTCKLERERSYRSSPAFRAKDNERSKMLKRKRRAEARR